jgi:hypothetical protein
MGLWLPEWAPRLSGHLSAYVLWKIVRKPWFATLFRIRRAAWPELSGSGALAAANSRARCVLTHGCPVLRVHRSFGLALHIGHRTDNIRRKVSFSASTLLLFGSAGLKDVQSCSVVFIRAKTGTDTAAIPPSKKLRQTAKQSLRTPDGRAEAILLSFDYFADPVGANQSANACASVGVPRPVTSSQPTPTFMW